MIASIPPVIQSVFELRLPPKIDCGIAFIGCGGIVNYGHIQAYRASGFHLIGGYDLNREAAEKTVRTHGLEKVYESLDDLLLDSSIEIVDISVLPWDQRDIIERGERLTSAKDNLGTLRVVEAAYPSMRETRSVSPSEIVAEILI